MNDVKYLCERALEDPRPPMTDAADVLTRVRRSVARRSALSAAAGLVSVAAVTAAVALVGPTLAARGPGRLAEPAVPVAAPPAAVLPPSTPDVPWPPTAERTERANRILLAALPPGYSGTVTTTRFLADPGLATMPRPVFTPDHPYIVSSLTSEVMVSAGGGQGQLWAVLFLDGKPAPTGELCVARPMMGAETSCSTVVVNGIPLRVSREFDAERRNVIVATRFLNGGALMVVAQQGQATYNADPELPPDAAGQPQPGAGHPPALGELFISADELAALAVNPELVS
jgi:hypothetical protein